MISSDLPALRRHHRCPVVGNRNVLRVPLVLIAALLLCGGCAGPSSSSNSPYTPQELAQQCQRGGGWWRPDVGTGYCELR